MCVDVTEGSRAEDCACWNCGAFEEGTDFFLEPAGRAGFGWTSPDRGGGLLGSPQAVPTPHVLAASTHDGCGGQVVSRDG